MAGLPDLKPEARIRDADAQPINEGPLTTGRCPCCRRAVGAGRLTRHHVVGRGQGGDDVPENLVWVCGHGTVGCHGVLTHHGRDGDTGLTYPEVAGRLLLSLDARVVAYAAQAKYPGWLHDHYLRGAD